MVESVTRTTRRAQLRLAGSIAGLGAFSAFSSTTTNSGNTFAAGTVVLADNDLDAAMYQVTNQKPGVTTEKCIKVTYTGSLPATVRLYTTSTIAASGQYVNLVVTPGTQATSTFPDCTGFTPASGGAAFTGTLSGFGTTHGSYANGLVVVPAGETNWENTDAVVYRFQVSVQDNDLAQGLSIAAHSYSWQAQNQ